jgi:hypothetical protein
LALDLGVVDVDLLDNVRTYRYISKSHQDLDCGNRSVESVSLYLFMGVDFTRTISLGKTTEIDEIII